MVPPAEPAALGKEAAEPPPAPAVKQRTAPRRLLADRLARWLVTAGGLGIIASILGILLFIILEVWPLTRPASVRPGPMVSVGDLQPAALLVDEHRTHTVVLEWGGRLRAIRLEGGADVAELDLLAGMPTPSSPQAAEARQGPPVELVAAVAPPGGGVLAAATSDGRVAVVPVGFAVDFEVQSRRVQPRIGDPVWLDLDPERRPVPVFAAHRDEDGVAIAAAQLADGSLAVVRREARENLLTGEVTESTSREIAALPGEATVLVIDTAQRNLYAGTSEGELLWASLDAGRPGTPQAVPAGAGVTALTLLVGDRALVLGQADGSLSLWFPVRVEGGGWRLTRIRDFPPHPGAVAMLSPSQRDKGFLAQDRGGRLGLYYSTSERVLWAGESPLPAAAALAYAPKGDAALLAAPGNLAAMEIRNPHPEVSWKALFGPVWYEGYEKPEYVWQSTGGTTDFESKLGLTPLLVGTLKGTVYALFLAVPLAVFAAMFASQFMHPRLLRYVKPTVEIMAALPTVILGFLAGLWLAPRLERSFAALLLMALVLPGVVLLTGGLWRALPRRLRGRFFTGSEVVLYTLALVGGIGICFALAAPFEAAVFGGNFQAWLLETTGLTYDQRNAIVVGLAMGFAVIPIIFAISEDAFSNVPRNLTAGSLALGANRWQTVTRVVLPTASPGIFSAVMIGFGRAVGETMIVLMATGNTPIMSWSPFNGFRTLSANIAVEIPEAPHSGTLYRVLFLAALLLFVFTFVVNTAAELVRQRLRRKYSQL